MQPHSFIIAFAIVIVAHYIADFLMQTTWQATNKGHNIYALSQHIYMYTVTLLLGLSGLFFMSLVTVEGLFGYVILNGSLHFFTDFVTSRLAKRALDADNTSAFWKIIGADQMIHNLCLLSTLPLLMS